MASHQQKPTRAHLVRRIRVLAKAPHRVHQRFDALLNAHLAHKDERPGNLCRLRITAKHPVVIARSNHVDTRRVNAIDVLSLLCLLGMKRKDGIEAANRRGNTIMGESMGQHLPNIGRMAHAAHGNPPHALAHQGAQQVQVVADDGIGLEGGDGMVDCRAKGLLEGCRHRRSQIAVACRGIGHHVRHAADAKRQLGRLERHGEHARGGVELPLRVPGRSTAQHRRLVARSNLRGHQCSEIRTASRAIGLLSRDVEDAQQTCPPYASACARIAAPMAPAKRAWGEVVTGEPSSAPSRSTT